MLLRESYVSRKFGIIFALVALMVMAPTIAAFAGEAEALRTLQGQVMADTEAPLPGAVVYLKNTKTMSVRSFVSDDKGDYRFTSLSPNVDYEVYAEYNGKQSDTKTLSSFDSRKVAYINLKIKGK